MRLVGFGSTSLPALKAFLQGEQLLRRSAWDSALVYYQRAIELDSTFAPAFRRASLALGWIRTGTDSLSTTYAQRAGELNHGLPTRDSLYIATDSVMASLLHAGTLGSGRTADTARGSIACSRWRNAGWLDIRTMRRPGTCSARRRSTWVRWPAVRRTG